MRPKKNPSEMSYLKLGYLAKVSGVNVSTINFFRKHGLLDDLLTKHSRPNNLTFKPEAIERIKNIRLFQSEKGLSLDEIKKFLKIK